MRNIKTPQDVAKFFMELVFDRSINLHPDDDFFDYIDREGNPTFTEDEAKQLNKEMETSFKVCYEHKRDVYEIAGRVLSLYHYCDGNDILAKMF